MEDFKSSLSRYIWVWTETVADHIINYVEPLYAIMVVFFY